MEGQTIQWSKDTKEVITGRKWKDRQYNGHCFWLPLWYLLTIVLSVLPFTACDYLFGIFWPLYCLSFHLRLVITTLVTFDHWIVCPSIYGLLLPLWYLLTIVLSVLPFTACDYHFDIFWPLHCLSFHLRLVITTLVSFDHCIVTVN
jgi:hypothetical protein